MVAVNISQLKTAVITWYDESDGYVTNADITVDVKGIPLLSKGISGEIGEMEIVLGAKEGNYLTSNGTATVIDKHDRIEVTLTDIADNIFYHVYEVETIGPGQSQGSGTAATFECLGIEKHVQVINYFKPHYFENAFNVVKDICDHYNSNAGARQPQISMHDKVYNPLLTIASSTNPQTGNGAPKFTNNFYDYGLSEDSCYNRLLDTAFKLGTSVDAGGVRDFFEVGFECTGVNAIDLRFFSSGASPEDRSGTIITFENIALTGEDRSVGENEGGIDNPTGTNIVLWGEPQSGSLPVSFSKYNSGLFQFTFRPEWDDTITYEAGAKVRRGGNVIGGKHWEARRQTKDDDPISSSSDWVQIDMAEEFGNTIQYSEWTDDKAGVFVNNGTNPGNATTSDGGITYLGQDGTSSGTAMFDGNMVIWNEQFFRTWVNAIADRQSVLDTLDDSDSHTVGDATTFPNGYRILIGAAPAAPFASNDANGVLYANTVTEFQASDSTWVVKYKPDTASDKMQVVVIATKGTFEWNDTTQQFDDLTNTDMANDCFHDYTSIANVAGPDPRPSETNNLKFPDVTKLGGTFSTNIKSAIEVTYQFGSILDRVTDVNDYLKHNACISFGYPMPYSTIQSISEGVGDIYKNDLLDAQNMHLDSIGLRGFNQGPTSEDFGQLNHLSFMCRMSILLASTGLQLNGLANMRCTIYDINDNVVTQDFEIKFTDGFTWQQINLSLSGFSVYRAHKPRYMELNAIADLIAPKQIDVQNIFEWRHIKFVTIQWQDQYDDFGRFNPENNLTDLSNTAIGNLFGSTVKLAIDALHWKKPLLSVTQNETSASGNRPNFNIEGETITKDYIMLKDQLDADAASELEIRQFQHKEFDYGTTGEVLFDVKEGDSIYLKNARLVSDSDNSVAFNMKGVAKRLEYAVTKPAVGTGGITRRIKQVKRFT